MKHVILFALLAVAALAAADAPPAAIDKTQADLISALTASQANPSMSTSAVSNSDRHRVNLVRRTKAAGAIAHPGFAELHHIVDGSGTLVTGGTIVRPTGGRGPATILNGVSRHVARGDVILIAPGMPHWYKDVDGTITYLEVRWKEE